MVGVFIRTHLYCVEGTPEKWQQLFHLREELHSRPFYGTTIGLGLEMGSRNPSRSPSGYHLRSPGNCRSFVDHRSTFSPTFCLHNPLPIHRYCCTLMLIIIIHFSLEVWFCCQNYSRNVIVRCVWSSVDGQHPFACAGCEDSCFHCRWRPLGLGSSTCSMLNSNPKLAPCLTKQAASRW